MWNHVRRGILPILAVCAATGAVGASDDNDWSVRYEAVMMDVYGHDQHVLNIRSFDFDPTPQTQTKDAVNLDTDEGFAHRFEFRHRRGRWGAGIDVGVFLTSQVAPRRTAAPDATIDAVTFEAADLSFSSFDPADLLFYEVLEDTDLESWTTDAYGFRTLGNGDDDGLIRLIFGIRLADFDNDYRAVFGIDGVAGARLDASSNYDLLTGPLVGLEGELHRGRNTIEGFFGQSVVLGTAELSSMQRIFTGSFGPMPTFIQQEEIRRFEDVALPISELRLRWSFRVSKRIAVGAGANTAVWWDVPVPPGVIPGIGGDSAFHENTLVFFGTFASVEMTF